LITVASGFVTLLQIFKNKTRVQARGLKTKLSSRDSFVFKVISAVDICALSLTHGRV